jgi:hypothetical protein
MLTFRGLDQFTDASLLGYTARTQHGKLVLALRNGDGHIPSVEKPLRKASSNEVIRFSTSTCPPAEVTCLVSANRNASASKPSITAIAAFPFHPDVQTCSCYLIWGLRRALHRITPGQVTSEDSAMTNIVYPASGSSGLIPAAAPEI